MCDSRNKLQRRCWSFMTDYQFTVDTLIVAVKDSKGFLSCISIFLAPSFYGVSIFRQDLYQLKLILLYCYCFAFTNVCKELTNLGFFQAIQKNMFMNFEPLSFMGLGWVKITSFLAILTHFKGFDHIDPKRGEFKAFFC